MVTVQEKVSTLITNLAKFHWSPKHPGEYVIITEGKPRGIGLIASKDYGAFNLAWGECRGKWETHADQLGLVTTFCKYQACTPALVKGEPIGDWATLLSPKAMQVLITEDTGLHKTTKEIVLAAVGGALRVGVT